MLRSAGSVRFQLFIAFGLVAAALWGAIAFALQTTGREAIEKARVEEHNLARSLAEHVALSVRAIDLSLITLADDWQRDPASFADAVARQRSGSFRSRDPSIIANSSWPA